MNYWVTRTAQWKAKYGSRENTTKKCLFTTYNMSDLTKIEGTHLSDSKLKSVETLWTVESTYGPPDHRCKVLLMPFGEVAGGFTMQSWIHRRSW